MDPLKYVYDLKKQTLYVFRGHRNVGGYIGMNAERKFNELLMTGVEICLGSIDKFKLRNKTI